MRVEVVQAEPTLEIVLSEEDVGKLTEFFTAYGSTTHGDMERWSKNEGFERFTTARTLLKRIKAAVADARR